MKQVTIWLSDAERQQLARRACNWQVSQAAYIKIMLAVTTTFPADVVPLATEGRKPFGMRMNPASYAQLQALARSCQTTMSEVIRWLIAVSLESYGTSESSGLE